MKRGLTAQISWSILAIAGVLSLSVCQRRSTEVLLRMKYEPGLETNHVQIARGSVRVTRNDSLISNEYVEARTDIQNHVLSVDPTDSVAQVAITLTAVDSETQPAGDSTWGKNDSTAAPQKRVVKYTEFLRPNGQLVDIDFESDKKSARPDYVKKYYEQAFPVFPSQPVTVGYTWTQTTKVSLPEGPVDASTKYTIKSMVRERGYNCAVVEYSGLCVIPLEPTKPDTLNCTQLLSGVDRINADGVIYFAYEEGFAVHERERWRLTGNRLEVTIKGDTLKTLIELDHDVDISLVSRTKIEDESTSQGE